MSKAIVGTPNGHAKQAGVRMVGISQLHSGHDLFEDAPLSACLRCWAWFKAIRQILIRPLICKYRRYIYMYIPRVSMTLSKWVHDPIILGNDPICLRVMETPGILFSVGSLGVPFGQLGFTATLLSGSFHLTH